MRRRARRSAQTLAGKMKRGSTFAMSMALAIVGGGSILRFSASVADSGLVPQVISVPVYFLSATGRPAPMAAIPKDLVIQLGAIAGSMGGTPDAPIQTFRVGPENEIRLDLAEISAELAKHAARFSEPGGGPLEMTPIEVKFARVSTFASTGSDDLHGLAVMFWDPEGNGSLVPFYCDRPCSLRAPKSAEKWEFDFPSTGLAWMLTTKDGNSGFVHVRAINPSPVIVIAPPEALERISPSTFAYHSARGALRSR